MSLFDKVFGKRIKVRTMFVDDTNHIHEKKLPVIDGKLFATFNKVDHAYRVDQKRVLYDKRNRPMLAYRVGDPEPLVFDPRHKDISAHGLRNVLEDKVVEELFKPEGASVTKLLLIIVIINTIILVVLAGMQSGYIKIGTGG